MIQPAFSMCIGAGYPLPADQHHDRGGHLERRLNRLREIVASRNPTFDIHENALMSEVVTQSIKQASRIRETIDAPVADEDARRLAWVHRWRLCSSGRYWLVSGRVNRRSKF